MNAPASIREFTRRDAADTAAQSTLEFTPYERMRLSMAATLAGGMLANPNIYKDPTWRGSVARDALKVADNLLTVHLSGGC